MPPFFLGVDVGSTKSHALISDEKGHVLGFSEDGPGNHEEVGYEGLAKVLCEVTNKVLQSAGLNRVQIAGAGFGVAGYDWPGERAQTLQAIKTLGLTAKIEAVNDAIIGLLAGASQGWGVAVVAGTGSNCWGWDVERRTAHLTGAGRNFGEYGGASDLINKAVEAISMEWSRRGGSTQLTPAFIKVTGASDLTDFIEGLSQGRYVITPAMGPIVIHVAAQGDPVARGLLRWMGRELGDQARGVIRQLQIEDMEFEVVLVGRLYDGNPLMVDAMRETIQTLAPEARLVRLSAPPVVGGVLLAMEQVGLDTGAIRAVLIQSIIEFLRDRKFISFNSRE
jgi:N-acetylglucosamine kinase-like BadF-type ATPase